MTDVLRMAIPNKGRLFEPTVGLLKEAGLSFEVTERSLTSRVRNADIELLFVRTPDIPELVSDGVAQLGITGQDLLVESNLDLSTLIELGYGRCRVAAAVMNQSPIQSIEEFDGLRVATSHNSITNRYFAGLGLSVTVIPLRGSIEVAPRLGVADGIVDLVSTGSTLIMNGLREIGTLLESEAVLITRPEITNGSVARIATALRAVVTARSKRYVLLNASAESVEAISNLIPGLEAPTVVPLAEQGWVAIHSVVEASEIWSLLPRLEAAGAKGILVLPIDQVIP